MTSNIVPPKSPNDHNNNAKNHPKIVTNHSSILNHW
jgi:hypothetical protein